MSDFWIGAFAALAVWQFVQFILSLALRGTTTEINTTTNAVHAALAAVCMAVAWYLSTFGGA